MDLDHTFDAIRRSDLNSFCSQLKELVEQHFASRPHGKSEEWDDALARLPDIRTDHLDLGNAAITIGTAEELTVHQEEFRDQLMAFHPWRKGPWNLFGTYIDTEWRSDLKWQRLSSHISPLADRNVLDIGGGNGYYLCRMLGEGARFALGIDPTLIFLYQFHAMQKYMNDDRAHILPLRGEHLPPFDLFDTVFSMGVLYHRREPREHLAELRSFLRPGGELVLETLVFEGHPDEVLAVDGRYAKMANVHQLPGVNVLEQWLDEAGYVNVRIVDVTRTTTEEQRATDWMTFQSLPDYLDPENPDLTVEGLPAPTRAVVIADKPSSRA